MRRAAVHSLSCPLIVGLLLFTSTSRAFSQSQASNGQIEGTVSDQNRAAVPNVVVTVTNIETGATRTITTNESGVYHFPLLPLGSYRITVEAPLFKSIVREGVTLMTGQIATVDFSLHAGEVREVVTVSADSSVADTGKTDLGRVMNTREVQNLPLIPRNPYNFGLLQANVTGRPSRGFPFPNINANGYLRRVNFLIDGNTNTQGDRGSVRFMAISDTYVNEIQLVTNGFAAEFGNTTGLIMNVVTPSGTNALHGAVSYRFRRPSFYSRPFFFPATDLPDNKANNLTGAVGAPIIKDRWHFYFGYEYQYRDDKAAAMRLLTITPANREQLIAAGLPPSIFPAAIPSLERGSFYIFRTDLQLNESNRLTARFNHAGMISENFIPGGLNTLERSIDAHSSDYALAVQLTSYRPQVFSEFRFQNARRSTGSKRSEFSGDGPAITITGVANFGAPATDTNLPALKITQFQDNLTRTIGAHAFKFGGGLNIYNNTERAPIVSSYTFPSIGAYVGARSGTNPRSYTAYVETFGDPEISYKASFWNFFAQDDWKLTRRLKLNYGLRYDLYQIPEADASSPFPASQNFNLDKNNFAPRIGGVYALREGDRPMILRFGLGIYYDAPLLATYRRALQNNGTPGFFSFSFTPATTNAPAFPNTFSGSVPPTLGIQDIDTIAPSFENMYAIHANIQLEQAITENLSIAAGYIHSAGRHVPVYRNINPINPVRFLADGRPVFSPVVNAATRLDPRFNIIQMAESVGVSQYDALTLQLTKRFSRGLQFSTNYTFSKAADDAPEQNMTTGLIQGLVLSDPTHRSSDKGRSFSDQRHTFVMTLVSRPRLSFENKTLGYLLNNNQFGIIATANSGETFNIISNLDMNNDGIRTADRPVGIKRNSGSTPRLFNLDLRYSRLFNLSERYKLEVFGEFQNLFNINRIVQYNNVTVATNPLTGELIGGLPDFRARNQSTSQDSRQFQPGFRFIF